VFISYSSADADFAENLSTKLQQNGFDVWLDQGSLYAGDDWREGVDEGLSWSDAVLVVLSERSAASAYVTFEWAFALGKGSAIIPILREKSVAHPRLTGLQYLDFSNPRVRPWEKLFAEVKRHSAQSTRAARRREADAVLQLATDLYATKLARQFERNHVGGVGGLGSTLPPGLTPSQTLRSVYAFGDMVHYDSATPSGEVAADLGRLLTRIAELRRRREAIYRAATLDLFFGVFGEADSITRTLGEIRFAGRTLDTVWDAAIKRVVAYWQEHVPGISYFPRSDVERIRQFIESHPAYPQLDVENRKAVEVVLAVSDVTIERLVVSTRDRLTVWLEEGLQALQAEA
jgi:hypothetical protein